MNTPQAEEWAASKTSGEMSASEAQTVYVQQDNTAVVKCPDCGTARSMNVESFKGRRKPLKLRCKCGSAFRVLLEFRRAYRKETRLNGNYVKLAPKKETGKIMVKNISRLGVGFTTLTQHNLGKGDDVLVTFTLDDANRSEIEKRAVVRVVLDRYIGCEFTDQSQHDKILGFYLMP